MPDGFLSSTKCSVLKFMLGFYPRTSNQVLHSNILFPFNKVPNPTCWIILSFPSDILMNRFVGDQSTQLGTTSHF